MYYLIQNGQIASGPHAVDSPTVRRLTSCGNPELLGPDLSAWGLVPEQRETLGAGQGYGPAELLADGSAVLLPAVDVEPPAPVVPSQVTMRQARAVLILAGMLPAVEAAIDAIADPTAKALARNEWERSTVVERNRGLVSQMAAGLGLSPAQIDALFIQAAAIP
jgi:hypothetical protein